MNACSEIAACGINSIWQSRTVQSKLETSTTHYDADMVPIAFNATPRKMAVYNHDPSFYQNEAMENLVWLISSNRDQALHILHQSLQGNIKI